MSVRGTTHARIMRKAIIAEGEHQDRDKIGCCWDECDRDGYMQFQARVNDHGPGMPPRWITYLFCSERHKQYWVSSYLRPGTHGRLPVGERGRIL